MKEYRRINVGIARGYPAVLAFVFEKAETMVYFGSYDKIIEYLRNEDLVHGIVLSYQNGVIIVRHWTLFGKGSVRNDFGTYYSLKRTNCCKWKYFGIPRGMTEKRNTWYLLKHEKGFTIPVVVGKWRKLPQKYLNNLNIANK